MSLYLPEYHDWYRNTNLFVPYFWESKKSSCINILKCILHSMSIITNGVTALWQILLILNQNTI